MDSNVSIIVGFLRGKGLNDAQVAGVLGNMRVESGFNPNAYNPGEGAIGLCQWEGGRRSSLQAFAASHGSTERDIHMQLGYLWRELQGSEHGAYTALLRARTPTEAAIAWDSQFERSAGTTRQQRIDGAQHYADVLGSGEIPASTGDTTFPDPGGDPSTAGMLPDDGSAFDMPNGQDVTQLHERYDHEMHAWGKVLGVDLQSGNSMGGPNEEALQTFLNSAVAQ